MKTKIILSITLSAFIFGCNSTSSNKEETTPEAETTTESAEKDKHEDENEEITLNNGEKWKVNEEMTPFILNAENILNQYDNGDYKQLAERLAEQNKSLVNSCTMGGKSHAELHKWLHPHLEIVKELKSAENGEKADELIFDLKESFETYHTYFK